MSDGKSYWSTMPGVVTGIASIVTAIVGLLGISVQAGWIGGDDDKASVSSTDGVATTTSPTVRGATTTSSPSTATTRVGEFEVEPQSITFEPLKTKEATITVRNTGDIPLTIRAPDLSGSGEAAFTVADDDCNSTLAPGRSCDITVTFAAPQPGEFAAKLAVAASNAPRQVEVTLKGERGLLG